MGPEHRTPPPPPRRSFQEGIETQLRAPKDVAKVDGGNRNSLNDHSLGEVSVQQRYSHLAPSNPHGDHCVMWCLDLLAERSHASRDEGDIVHPLRSDGERSAAEQT